ncbi:hypothetical protein ACERIT_05465 [Halopenitus sp. H-Gu1]|uniref:DUF7533 family protein n=1 Tax=Halopenitus sp. H-Gu1 TaxID=3242697 RepID=UPI00359E2565
MRLGILDTIGLATTVVFALPVANYGVIRAFEGETALGIAMVGVAIAMVVLPQYFLDPERILRGLLAGLLPRRLRSASEEDTKTGDAAEPIEE